VVWKRVEGLVEPGSLVGRPLDNSPCDVGVDCVEGARAPWTIASGSAEVDLDRGEAKFVVSGLVIAGDPTFANLGTTTAVTRVRGTLVCNDTEPGAPELVDTASVRLSGQGNASFRGPVDLPSSCADEPEDIVFLIRIAEVVEGGPPIEDLWIAFGAVRAILP
jgi:hypothetical protein